MNRIKTFLAISVSFVSFAVAQSPGEGWSAFEKRIDQTSSEINLQMLQNLPAGNGFYVDLPADVKMIPSSVSLSGTEFWLKKSNELPTNPAVVHWEVDSGRIVFLFAKDVLSTGDNLSIIFQSHSIEKSAARALSVRSLLGNNSDNFQAGEIQNTVQLVQTQK